MKQTITKKLLSLIIVISLCLCNGVLPVFAENDITITLSKNSVGIDHINSPTAEIEAKITGKLPFGAQLKIESESSLDIDSGDLKNGILPIYITANWRLGTVDKGNSTISIVDSNGKTLCEDYISVYTTTKKYTITYDNNGGVDGPVGQYKYHNADYQIPYYRPVRQGYEFRGWTTVKGSDKEEYDAGDFLKTNADCVLYAIWEKMIFDISFENHKIIDEGVYEIANFLITGYDDLIDNVIIECDDNIEATFGTSQIDDNNYLQLQFTKTGNIKSGDVHIYVLNTREEVLDEADLTVFSCDSNINDIDVIVNGKEIKFDVEPTIINGRTLVPMRAIFEALGAKVDWDSKTLTASGKTDDTLVEITIGDNFLFRNKIKTDLDSPAKIISNRTMVPVRAIAESFDCTVNWHPEHKVVEIISN